MPPIEVIITVCVVAFVLFLLLAGMIKRLMCICSPNEVLIFSGSGRQTAGRMVGYKVIKGGRRLRIPLLETVDRMDLTNMAIDLEVRAAYAKGGIPLNVVGIANVKLAGHSPILDNGIERFLGKSQAEIMLIAKETLEGTLRGVLATLTPEEVNEDKMKFAQALLEEASDDLNRLGLMLDTLKIQDVSDEVQYLDSIGRKRSAEIQRKARIAESEAASLARVREAENKRETELKRVEAEIETIRAENQRRIADAVTRGKAMIAEQRGQVTAEVARAEAELDVQRARIERERRRLTADILEPARAEKSAKEAKARADAASIIEEGRAQAEAMRSLAETWKSAGSSARDVFLMQKLDAVMSEVLSTMGDLSIDRITVLGTGGSGGKGGGRGDGDGSGGPSSLAHRLIQGNEELRATLGVDLAGALATRLAGGGAATQAEASPPRKTSPDQAQPEAARPRKDASAEAGAAAATPVRRMVVDPLEVDLVELAKVEPPKHRAEERPRPRRRRNRS